MIYLLYTIHIVLCLFLILVVLLQQGKGADLSVFGGGGTLTAFGARSATSLLHRLTVGAFVGFVVTTLSIAFVQAQSQDSSVMSDAPAATAPAPADAAPVAAEPAPTAEEAAPVAVPATTEEPASEGGERAPGAN